MSWTCLAEPRTCIGEGSRRLGGGDPSQPWPTKGKGWMAQACRGPARRLAEGEACTGTGRRESSGAGGRPFFLWARIASAKPLQSPLWPSAREQPQPSGPTGWVSCLEVLLRGACTRVRGRLPLLPGPGLGRREAQAWAWCPAGSAPWAGSGGSLLRMQGGPVSPAPQIPQGGQQPGVGHGSH